MARDSEKANMLFNKWKTFKNDAHSEGQTRRPALAQSCNSLEDADRFRRELVQQATKKIQAIKNTSLSEHMIRTLNDEINKLMKTLYHWNKRVRELGGPDRKKQKTALDIEGKALPGAPGYRYYGAAQTLTGVKELFDEAEDSHRNKRHKSSSLHVYEDIIKNLKPDYYGGEEYDTKELLKKELARETQLIKEAQLDYDTRKNQYENDMKANGGVLNLLESTVFIEDNGKAYEEEDIDINNLNMQLQQKSNDVNSDVVDAKKKALLDKYA